MVNYGCIYKIENSINGKIYIGQTRQDFNKRYCAKGNGIERVYNYHKNNKGKGMYYNKHLLASFDKYGIYNFKLIEVFDVATNQEELNKKEIYWINKYISYNPMYGYNTSTGGEGFNYNGLRKFLRRKNNSYKYNSDIDYLISKFKKHEITGIHGNFGFVGEEKRKLVRRVFWGRKIKKCKYCDIYYYRKYDKNNLCEKCNIMDSDTKKQVKKILKNTK